MTDLDPVEVADAIVRDYQRYLGSLTVLRDEHLSAALAQAIENDAHLSSGLIVEASPAYARGATLAELVDEGVLPAEFGRLDSRALPMHRPLYVHQEEAIRRARMGRSLVVSTGTGSGKTESFLIPILASLVEEAEKGPLTPGVRALLLYPMNALANDQMKRLRQLLAGTPDITFGRYIGDTPQSASQALASFEQLNPGEPRLPNELLSREEMQQSPPHILLTNYAMLEYLLLRPADMDLFEGGHSGSWKFVVVDEAHVYDGARGSELAMLLRRLQSRVGADELQCIATSATVGADSDPASVTDFAASLFGTSVEWVEGESSRQDLVRAKRVTLPEGSWGPLSPSDYRELAAAADPEAYLRQVAESVRESDDDAPLEDLLATERTMATLRRQLAVGPKRAEHLHGVLGPEWGRDELRTIIEAGGRIHDDSGVPLLSARYHLWLRSTEGAFACLSAQPHVYLSRQEHCLECDRPCFEFGGCTRCGSTYILGHEEPSSKGMRLLPRSGEAQRPTWVAMTADLQSDDEDDLVWGEDIAEVKDAVEVCIDCGFVNSQGAVQCEECSGSALRSGRVIRGHSRQLTGCVVCGSRSKGQVRLFDTGADAAASVIATSLYQALPPDSGPAADNPGGGRKLLAFSDSRQGAAYFAPYLENSYRRLLHRRLLLQGIRESCDRDRGPSRLDDVIANTARIATEQQVFPRRESRQAKEREVGLWLSQELVAFDARQSLEGLGQIVIRPEGLSEIASQEVWATLGLDPAQAEDVLVELLASLRSQGAVTFPEGVDPADEAFAPRLGPIHVREQQSDRRLLSWLPSAGSNRRLDYLTRVLAASGATVDPSQVLSGVWRALTAGRDPYLKASTHPRHGTVYQLDHQWLVTVIPGGAEPVYRCSVCARTTMRSVFGVCPAMRCTGSLIPEPLAEVRQVSNHYAQLHTTMAPIPIRVQEHTAQWNALEAAEIQNEFVRGEVNVLSCSTTFELGVDVGELQSVLLRNIPPATANYVQRAGRAGRRSSSSALVVAFAQRRSHDLSRFQEPLEMISGVVTPPRIPLGNERIDRRHAHSVAFSSFFRSQWRAEGRQWRYAGDFFSPEDGAVDALGLLAEHLEQRPADIEDSLRRILPQSVQEEIGVESGAWIEGLLEHLDRVQLEVRQEVDFFEQARVRAFEGRKDRLAAQFGRVLSTIRKRDLLGFLGSRNVLPKYGFPADVVDLRTATSSSPVGLKLDLSRDLATAVYEYAPGAEIVAGGLLWRSAGVYRLPERDLVSGWFARCDACQFFEESLEELEPACPSCAGSRRPMKYMIPEFGFIADKEPTKPSGAPPKRSWFGGTHFVSPGTVVDQGPADGEAPLGVRLEASRGATLMAVSTSSSDQGYLICDWCGRGLPTEGKTPKKHDHAWKGTECTGPLTRAALAHKYQTDVLTVEFRSGLLPDSNQAWSLLYGLLDAAATVLGISRDDIDGTLWFSGSAPRLVLFDTVPGGAGCVLRIPARAGEIVKRASTKLATCECGIETSCYACLRSYRNSIRHDILSRGAAIELLERLGVT